MYVCMTGKMTVDGDTEVTGEADGEYVGLDLSEPLYIGGVPDFSQIHAENGFNQGFVGETREAQDQLCQSGLTPPV